MRLRLFGKDVYVSQGERDKRKIVNKFNEAFYQFYGGGYTNYDENAPTYIEKGYNSNPVVYSVIKKQATKTSSIPYYIKKIEDTQAKSAYDLLIRATEYKPSIQQKVKLATLENKAYQSKPMPMPLENPNPNQTWVEFFALYKTFLKLTGNVYIYMATPEEGPNAGEPKHIYLLPSQYIEIRTDGINIDPSQENPVSSYRLTYGNRLMDFEADDVVHIKYANPNYDQNGEHLYGFSPIRAALRNILSTDIGLDLNIRTLKSGGAFGFFYGKNTSLKAEQAKAFKDQLIEMNSSPEDLSKIAGSSVEMGFQRISLTSDELKPFDYFQFDQKQICNILGYSDKLLNNDQGAKYDNIKEVKKEMITDDIAPDLKLFEEAFNKQILPKFKGYDKACIVFDYNELPEMQGDVVEMSSWLKDALDRGVVSRNEYRVAIRYAKVDNTDLDVFTVSTDIIPLDEALNNDFSIE